ncbi:MAG: TrkH family potassium uptake protein [Candidatus Aureabacteria bacterium]|nr:TrkH family potassium uptake protein [Candidatus Auribacterota bacterium]
MILRPRLRDIRIIGYQLGRIVVGVGLLMLLPLLTGLLFRETVPVLDYLIGMGACLSAGYLLRIVFHTREEPTWTHGLTVAALSWLAAALLSAIPLLLSGHFASYLDAFFEAMSGYATTGLSLAVDLDHLAHAHNMWRHFIMYVGGQGIIVVALTFLLRGSGAFTFYVGEARDERIFPNVRHTARFIWLVSLVYLALGASALFLAGLRLGLAPVRAFLHGLWIFMAAWDTGGFAPQSQNILYYHSFGYELITISVMFLGALNFKLHYAVWTGNRREIFRNIEVAVLCVSILFTFAVCAAGLSRLGVYPGAVALFRKGFYQVISGHVGTGYSTIYPRQFVREWGGLAMVAVIAAMAVGGCACSTAGGMKALRLGILFKALAQDIKRLLFPPSAVVLETFTWRSISRERGRGCSPDIRRSRRFSNRSRRQPTLGSPAGSRRFPCRPL